jgi:hypothetical protein
LLDATCKKKIETESRDAAYATAFALVSFAALLTVGAGLVVTCLLAIVGLFAWASG